MLPTETFSYDEMFKRNLLGDNVGNLVYQYSICKTLMRGGGTEFVSTRYRFNYSAEELEELNQTCEMFVIPLANAFRKSFVAELKGLTRMVKALKMPCIVIGVGIEAPIGSELHFPFDSEVKSFVSAVLDKSALLGVRGQITADYLERLGFTPEKDFTVIGCPSMYMNPEIRIRDTIIDRNSETAFNISPEASKDAITFIRDNAGRFRSATYIPQNVADLKLMYAGIPRIDKASEGFPCNIEDDVFRNAAFPGNIPGWKAFLQSKDFSFGTRLHGNIMAVLSGTPSIHISFNSRVKEVVDYHNLTQVSPEDLKKARDIFGLIEKADFHAPEKRQKANFDHYVDFLNANRIRHIYLPTEKAAMNDDLIPGMAPLTAITEVSREEGYRRVSDYGRYAEKIIASYRKQRKEANSVKDTSKAGNKTEKTENNAGNMTGNETGDKTGKEGRRNFIRRWLE